MKRRYGEYEWGSVFVEDRKEGWGGFDLYRCKQEKQVRVARIAYWDASGEFVVETFEGDVPLIIIEELIDEAKTSIKLR